MTKVAVVGAGAIGGAIGGLLTLHGHDVVLVDQWPEHVETMRSRGLRLTIGPLERPEVEHTIAVRARHVHEVCGIREMLDVVFLACKSYDTRWMTQLIEPNLAPDGVVVSVQNSLNDEWIAPIVGAGRAVACVLTAGGELLEPGHVWRNRRLDYHYYTIGEVDGSSTPRLTELAALLGDAGRTTVSARIWGARWSKLVTNTASAAMSGLVDPSRREWDLVDEPAWRAASAALYREGAAVAVANGVTLEPLFGMTAADLTNDPNEVVRRIMAAKAGGASEGATTMIQQDLRRGRPTEVVGYFNGLIARKGLEKGIPTPMNDAMVRLYVRLEAGELAPSLDNLDRLVDDASLETGAATGGSA